MHTHTHLFRSSTMPLCDSCQARDDTLKRRRSDYSPAKMARLMKSKAKTLRRNKRKAEALKARERAQWMARLDGVSRYWSTTTRMIASIPSTTVPVAPAPPEPQPQPPVPEPLPEPVPVVPAPPAANGQLMYTPGFGTYTYEIDFKPAQLTPPSILDLNNLIFTTRTRTLRTFT